MSKQTVSEQIRNAYPTLSADLRAQFQALHEEVDAAHVLTVFGCGTADTHTPEQYEKFLEVIHDYHGSIISNLEKLGEQLHSIVAAFEDDAPAKTKLDVVEPTTPSGDN